MNVVLVPQPSEDVNDPLRWPTWKKYFAFLNVCLLTFMTTCFISGFSPGLYLLSVEFKRDLSTTTGLILWPLLTSGLGVSALFSARRYEKLTIFPRISSGSPQPNTSVNDPFLYLHRYCCSVVLSGLLCRKALEAFLPVASSQHLRALQRKLSVLQSSTLVAPYLLFCECQY